MLSKETILRRIIETRNELKQIEASNLAGAALLSERIATYQEVLQDEKDNSLPVPVIQPVYRHWGSGGAFSVRTDCACPSPGFRADRPNCGNHGAPRRISDEDALQKGMEIMQRVRDKNRSCNERSVRTPFEDAEANARRYRESAESVPCESAGF